MNRVLSVLAAITLALPAMAQELPGRRDALQMIFPSDAEVESVVFPHPSLNEAQVQLLSNAIAQGLMPQMLFYGALAIAPDTGLADPQTTVAVGNFHDEVSAANAALDRCDAARDEEATPCVIVLVVRPAGWQPGATLQLSVQAAEALRSEFRRLSRPRIFATSLATGQYGMGEGLEAALSACGQPDCRAVIADN